MQMNIIDPKNRKISPELAVKILKENGQNVSLKEARIILDFMYKIAKLSVNQYIKL